MNELTAKLLPIPSEQRHWLPVEMEHRVPTSKNFFARRYSAAHWRGSGNPGHSWIVLQNSYECPFSEAATASLTYEKLLEQVVGVSIRRELSLEPMLQEFARMQKLIDQQQQVIQELIDTRHSHGSAVELESSSEEFVGEARLATPSEFIRHYQLSPALDIVAQIATAFFGPETQIHNRLVDPRGANQQLLVEILISKDSADKQRDFMHSYADIVPVEAQLSLIIQRRIV